MLAATIRLVQVLDQFEIRAVITTFNAGMDPEQFEMRPLRIIMTDEDMNSDALSIITRLIRLWSEVTISE